MSDNKKRVNTTLHTSTSDFLRVESAKRNITQGELIEKALKNTYGELMKEYINNYDKGE